MSYPSANPRQRYHEFLKNASPNLGDVGFGKFSRQQQGKVLVAYVTEQIVHVVERVDLIELAAFHQAVIDGRGMTGPLGADEEKGFAAHGHRAHAALGVIIVRLQVSVLGIARQRVPVLERIAHRLTECAFRQHRVDLFVQPGLELGEDRDRFGLAYLVPFCIVERADFALDPVEFPDKGQRHMRPAGFFQQGRDLDKLTPGVRQARDLLNIATRIERVIAGIGIGLEIPFVVSQERGRGIAAAGTRELIDRQRLGVP